MQEFILPVIQYALPPLFGLLSGLFVVWASNKKTDKEAGAKLTDQLMERIELISNRLEATEKEVEELRIINLELTAKNRELEAKLDDQFNPVKVMYSFFAHSPAPCWIKDLDGRMLYINDSYEREWDISRLKYEGQRDRDVWSEVVADTLRQCDSTVLTKMKGTEFKVELPKIPDDDSSPSHLWSLVCFPIVYKGKIIALGGYAYKEKRSNTR